MALERKNCGLEVTDSTGSTALLLAVKSLDMSAVKQLAEKVNRLTSGGNSRCRIVNNRQSSQVIWPSLAVKFDLGIVHIVVRQMSSEVSRCSVII